MSADGSSLLLLVCAQSISGSSLSSDLISWSVSGVWIWNLDPRVPSRASTHKGDIQSRILKQETDTEERR